MGVGEAVEDLEQQARQPRPVEGRLEVVGRAVRELHREPGAARAEPTVGALGVVGLERPGVVDPDDVPVLELSHRAGFGREPRAHLGLRSEPRQQDLQRPDDPQPEVAGLEHGCLPPFTEP